MTGVEFLSQYADDLVDELVSKVYEGTDTADAKPVLQAVLDRLTAEIAGLR